MNDAGAMEEVKIMDLVPIVDRCLDGLSDNLADGTGDDSIDVLDDGSGNTSDDDLGDAYDNTGIGTIVDYCDLGRMEACLRDDVLERVVDGDSYQMIMMAVHEIRSIMLN